MMALKDTAALDLPHLQDLISTAGELAQESRSPRTREAYAQDMRLFSRWCDEQGLPTDIPIDPAVVVAFLAGSWQQRSAATLARYLAAIRYMHHKVGQPSPTDHPQVREVLAGIRRRRQDRRRQVRPLYLEDVAAAVRLLPDTPKGHRDGALLLAGWWGAFRRSELVGLDTGDLEDHPAGMIVHLRRSKTDQAGEGLQTPLHYRQDSALCPVLAVRRWLQTAGIDGGPVFRPLNRWGQSNGHRLAGQAVALIVKEAARSIGMDPAEYGGHSLRSGFVSECDRRQIPTSAVRMHTHHQSDAMLATYTRPQALFDSAAGALFDL